MPFFRPTSVLVPLLPACAIPTAFAEAEAPSTHEEMTQALISLLSETEMALRSCTDESSTRAAIPRLQELSQLAQRLAALQNTLPEPTEEDYQTAQTRADTFALLWKEIRGHIERLEQAGLMSDELRAVLRVAKP